jgi:hypothetical protein
MTEEEFRARVAALFDAEYEALGVDTFRALFGDAIVSKVLAAAVSKRMRTEAEHDDEFSRAWQRAQASLAVGRHLEDAKPKGAYRPDGILPISGDKCVRMPMATREHLLAWALHEADERNLDYIKSRLDWWNSRPQCKTLAELESDLGK